MNNGNKVDDSDENELTCGLGQWRPNWLQRWATPKVFLLNFSLVAIFQGASFTYLIGSMTTLEKRYGFESKISGFILIADNISQMLINPFIGYLGTKYNRPMIMAVGEMIVALSCFLYALPFYIYGPLSSNIASNILKNTTQNIELCDQNREISCQEESVTIWPAVIILWIGSFVNGIGYTAFYTIGLPYIDDNTSKRNSPMYLSLTAALRLLGPSMGFLLSSFCLSLYENPFETTKIDSTDPQWIGAWWIGYLFIGACLFLCSIPLMVFPTQMRATKTVQSQPSSKSALSSFKRLIKNPIFIFNLLGMSLRLNGYLGYYMFKPKYIEAQFKKSASNANMWTGLTSIPTMAIGIMAGGIFVSKFRPRARNVVTYMFVIELLTNTALIGVMFVRCPLPHFPQTVIESPNLDLSAKCNQDCKCSRIFHPVCAEDNKSNYYSPCFAGCTHYDQTSSEYTDCQCISTSAKMTNGYCKSDCNQFPIYISIIGVAGVVMSTAKIGDTLLTLRCVEQQDKNFAMGVIGSFLAIFTFIPYPLIFGTITDMACIVWKEICGKTGNCWLYDIEKFRYLLHLSSYTFLMIGTLFNIPIIFYANRIENMFEDKLEVQNDSDKSYELAKVNHGFSDTTNCKINLKKISISNERKNSLKDYELVHRKNSFVTL